jgi:hypothetical protein
VEKRNFIRTSMKCDFAARFQLGGQTCSPVQISNLSIHGCCLQLPAALTRHLLEQPVLDNFILFRDVREYPVKGRIVWHDFEGKEPKVGVEFLETSKECLRAVRGTVAEELLFWNTAS